MKLGKQLNLLLTAILLFRLIYNYSMPSKVLSESDSLVNSIKRNCKMCSAYRNFQPLGKEKPIVQASLKHLYDSLFERYNFLKKTDAEGRDIVKAAEDRHAVLDFIDECNACDKEFDRVGQKIKGMKF